MHGGKGVTYYEACCGATHLGPTNAPAPLTRTMKGMATSSLMVFVGAVIRKNGRVISGPYLVKDTFAIEALRSLRGSISTNQREIL